MATQQRRLAILSSHLSPSHTTQNIMSSSLCPISCSSDNNEINPNKNDCVFCQIITGKSQAIKLYEDDICLCIFDKNPLCHGHSLIIPKSHFTSLEVTPPHVVAAMCSKVPFISRAIMKATGCESFNLLVNSGAPAGQVIYHTHIHIIPRKPSDCLWTSESFGSRRRTLNFDQSAYKLADHVREQLSDIPEDNEVQESRLS
ncbi:hypothetical protein ACFE04_000554 [Oxalis oulophora]